MQNTNKLQSSNKVLVIGGGMGGIRTALDLAEAEKDVVLVDKAPAIGGLMTQLDRTFPTNNCDLCTLAPNLSESSRQDHIDLLALTSVTDVQGEKGNFTVSLTTAPRYVNLDKCTACGECHKAFPECVTFTPGLDHRAPTCMRYPQATPQAFAIDLTKCDDVEALMKVCPAGAINPDDIGRNQELKCGAIVFSPGASLFDPSHLDYLAYATQPDVVTSLEYERILSASGPTQGKLVRPSNGEPPKKVAWIQCIGSRGLQKGAGEHCSSACCMFAMKEAMVTRERFGDDIEATIFYMDMRTFGKDYELLYTRAKDEFGVRFVHSRPHSILQPEGEEKLLLSYTNDGSTEQHDEAFDMVVLSTGFKVGDDVKVLAEKMGIELRSDGFPKTESFNPQATSVPGIYVCGAYQAPKDIPETMIQASAAACMASRDVESVKKTKHASELFPAEREVANEAPKVGVFVCECGENIGNTVNVEQLVESAGKISNVAVAQAVGHGCSRESMATIKATIEEQGLNRVVIGGCSPRTHQEKFQDLLRSTGLNKYLLEIANIREQATWVHPGDPARATAKAEDLIKMAVGGVLKAQPLADQTLPMNKDALVVGGGVAGMTAAIELADQGSKVYLAEKFDQLGGITSMLSKTLEGADVKAFLAELIEKVNSHENIEVITRALIVDHTGMPGMFKTGMQVGKQLFYRQISHGVTILATGAKPNRPDQYLLDRSDKVGTQIEIQNILDETPELVKSWDNVVMIQCVGSRNEDNPNCSRICCQNAIKNALRITDINPEARVFVLYRDMRTYGFQEEYYRKAREKGVIFVRYDLDNLPQVAEADGLIDVTFTDPLLGREITVSADQLCLSTGLIADQDTNEEIAMIFKLPRTHDGYFLEDHIKLRPVDLPEPGFFIAGTAHSPKSIRESVSQARAAASRALTMLTKDTINLGARVARVDGDKCAACLVCVRACPFDVPFINADGYSEIDPAKCQGCGACASECPAKAIQLMEFEDDRILAKLQELFLKVNA
ncbi:FAD-dependent oxidoreductase [Desulfosediminicola sp.]|uniref:FAD-dependent oxidoreductase n=1 Tax=Desulfosediminicola sp. TaxID=2886825 RepID=UPI003AF2F28A